MPYDASDDRADAHFRARHILKESNPAFAHRLEVGGVAALPPEAVELLRQGIAERLSRDDGDPGYHQRPRIDEKVAMMHLVLDLLAHPSVLAPETEEYLWAVLRTGAESGTSRVQRAAQESLTELSTEAHAERTRARAVETLCQIPVNHLWGDSQRPLVANPRAYRYPDWVEGVARVAQSDVPVATAAIEHLPSEFVAPVLAQCARWISDSETKYWNSPREATEAVAGIIEAFARRSTSAPVSPDLLSPFLESSNHRLRVAALSALANIAASTATQPDHSATVEAPAPRPPRIR